MRQCLYVACYCSSFLWFVRLLLPMFLTAKKYSANTKCKLQLWVKIGMRRHRRRSRSSFDSSFGSMVVVTTCVWSTSHVHLCPSIHWCAYAMRPIVSSSSANATNYNLVSACTTSNIDLPFVRSASTPIPLAAVLFLFRRLFFSFLLHCICFDSSRVVASLVWYTLSSSSSSFFSVIEPNERRSTLRCYFFASALFFFFAWKREK